MKRNSVSKGVAAYRHDNDYQSNRLEEYPTRHGVVVHRFVDFRPTFVTVLRLSYSGFRW